MPLKSIGLILQGYMRECRIIIGELFDQKKALPSTNSVITLYRGDITGMKIQDVFHLKTFNIKRLIKSNEAMTKDKIP